MTYKTEPCFNCGRATTITINSTGTPANKKAICLKEGCWKAWRKLAEK